MSWWSRSRRADRRPSSAGPGRHAQQPPAPVTVVLPPPGTPASPAPAVDPAAPPVPSAPPPAPAPAGGGSAAVPVPQADRPVAQPPVPPAVPAAPVPPVVGLVFADGAEVTLEPADPRLRAFRAASAALVERR